MATDRRLAVAVVSAVAFATCAAWFGQPLIHGNEHAQELIATFFSIIAGLLIAIMTILGDPSILARRSWRAAEMGREYIEGELIRQKLLFVLYLTTLGFLLNAAIGGNTTPQLTETAEYIYLFLGTFAFLLSLGLPWRLMKIQLDRYDALIQDKRRQVGPEGLSEASRSSCDAMPVGDLGGHCAAAAIALGRCLRVNADGTRCQVSSMSAGFGRPN